MRKRSGAIYAVGWLVLVATYSVAFVANGVPAGGAIRNAAANLLPDALLGLAILRLPDFLPWPGARKTRFFAAHAGLLAAAVLLSTVLWMALVALDSFAFNGRAAQINVRVIPFRVVIDLLIYGTLAGIAYARRNAEGLQDQAERAARAEALRARASLEALRSQLNPHFILNAFHAIVGLMRRDPATAETALERLGDLLRYGVRIHRDGIDEVPLREECAFVESYLSLERMRLADRLRVSVDAPDAALECLVPAFAVQILVENAIRHAIAPRAAGGLLGIHVRQDGGRLRVAVTDEGNGGAEARFEGSRMGLRLLQERLAALYGAEASLTLRAVAGGTCADLELPARRVGEASP
jgi:sensor histidine kinase YesM